VVPYDGKLREVTPFIAQGHLCKIMSECEMLAAGGVEQR